MALVPFHRLHRVQRIRGTQDQGSGRNVPEVVRGQVRQQRKPHVGRRRAVRNHVDRMFLIIVRWQPVVVRADERLEERPGPPRELAEEDCLLDRESRLAAPERLADPPGDRGRDQPQAQYRRAHCQGSRRGCGRRDRRGRGDEGGDPHRPEGFRKAGAAGCLDARAGLARLIPRWSPLEQPSMADQHSPRRARDRIEVDRRLVRKEGEREHLVGECLGGGARRGCEMLLQQHLVGLPHHAQEGSADRRDQQDPDDRGGPEPRRRQHGPSEQQQQRQGDRKKAAPKVVEELPLRQPRERILLPAHAVAGHLRQQPPGQLPVAANPAMPALHVRAVAGGILLVQLGVAHQARPDIATFQQVVAQDPVLREPPAECPLERVDLVDSLADERAFAEDVLVHVGDRARIGIDARLAGVQARVPRACLPGQTCSHTRLQDSVAPRDHRFADALAHCLETGTVEWVLHRADELTRRVAGQLRIGIERDDILHVRQCPRVANDEREAVARTTAQERIEVGKLSALALMAHPQPFLRIPAARTVEEKEAAAIDVPFRSFRRAPVLPVQPVDPLSGHRQQRSVARQRFLGRVLVIGQQREMQVGVPIGQEAHFEGLDQAFDVCDTCQHRRNHDQRARLRRKPVREVHSRQCPRRDQEHRQPVHYRHRQLAGGEQREDSKHHHERAGRAAGMGLRQQRPGQAPGDQCDRAQV